MTQYSSLLYLITAFSSLYLEGYILWKCSQFALVISSFIYNNNVTPTNQLFDQFVIFTLSKYTKVI